MTLRLVALMSVVLLLSLAAFGLLMDHYQTQFMDEVARTASTVGQAALRTLDSGEGEAQLEMTMTADVLTWQPEHGVLRPHVKVQKVEQGVDEEIPELEGVIVAHADHPDGEGTRIERVKHVVTTSTDDGLFTISEQRIYPADAFPSSLPGADLGQRLGECLGAETDVSAEGQNRFFISVEGVRAESDPAKGLVLKIPTFMPADDQEAPGEADYEFHPASSRTEDNVVLFGRKSEIQLPIPLEHYRDLFQTIRNRSLFLFLGVFVVGTVLSTGLATRFTRPIRKLDAGIRRLSAGDLDVTVDARGKNEIGRLGRAFNEMAGKLRANREREREMVRREKLSALGRLAAGVAHDVRNPLHSIGLTLEHLSDTARPTEPQRTAEFDRSLGVIRGEIRRLDQLVSNFLRFAKSEPRAREPVDLAELLRETVRLVRKEAEWRNIEIELDVDEATPRILGDGEGLRSSVLNLVLNSFEAMPDGGRLTVTLRHQEKEALLVVADTGEGIPTEECDRVFDFAYTTRKGGNGMGLAMVHHCVVEEHGGRVALDSSPGQGTRVRLELPIDNGNDA